MKARLLVLLLPFILVSTTAFASVIDESDSLGQKYDTIMDKLFADERVVTTIGDKLWVPWYSTSSSCEVSNLQKGGGCSASTIDGTHNCMVTDEFSQVGILASMGRVESRMDQFYNTVQAIKSTHGTIPAWRIYRDGDSIDACMEGINGNCDTASDATARIITSLFIASKNPNFQDSAMKAKYSDLAKAMSNDFLQNEVVNSCKDTKQGQICNWLAGCSETARGGLASGSFTYTGYFGDAILAMIVAYENTGEQKYFDAAEDFAQNFLLAANWDGSKFTVPPGRSFSWKETNGELTAVSDYPPWDDADAPRAVSVCQANYYATKTGKSIPKLDSYCSQWAEKYMNDPSSAVIQYNPDGTPASGAQSGYYAQGLQAILQLGINADIFKQALTNAMSHYNSGTGTFDSSACLGVYHPAYPLKALGQGLGRDLFAFDGATSQPTTQPTQPSTQPATQPSQSTGSAYVAGLGLSLSIAGTKKTDKTEGSCRTVSYDTQGGELRLLGCEKGDYVEVYRQVYPNMDFKACVGAGCVDKNAGFAKFPKTMSTPVTQPSTTTQPATTKPAILPAILSISSLGYTCVNNGKPCVKKSDITSGVCRTVVADTVGGELKMLACDKGSSIEVYRQSMPSGDFKGCLQSACIDK